MKTRKLYLRQRLEQSLGTSPRSSTVEDSRVSHLALICQGAKKWKVRSGSLVPFTPVDLSPVPVTLPVVVTTAPPDRLAVRSRLNHKRGATVFRQGYQFDFTRCCRSTVLVPVRVLALYGVLAYTPPHHLERTTLLLHNTNSYPYGCLIHRFGCESS